MLDAPTNESARQAPGAGFDHQQQQHDSTATILRRYIEQGLVLVPIPAGTKGPRSQGWNQRENCWEVPEDVPDAYAGNIGLAHAYAGTCALDIDNYEAADAALATHGIDLSALLTADHAVQIRSGRPNRAKLLYRLPAGLDPMPSVDRTDAGDGFELRCGARSGLTVQDVLPPSVHPDTDKPYEWIGDWRHLPELPIALLTLWRKLLTPQGSASSKSDGPRATVEEGRHADVLRLAARVARVVVKDGLRDEAGMALLKEEQARGRWSRDVTDELDRAYRGALAKLRAGTWTSPDKDQGEDFAPQDREERRTTRRLVVCTALDLLTLDLPPREMLLGPWLESQSLTMIYAWRGIGKTHVALGIGYALASGGTFLNWRAPSPVPVMYIDGEMPGPALKKRVAGIVASADKEAQADYLRFITPDLQPDGVMPNLATIEGQAEIEDVLGDARVVIVDNLSCLVRGGKENEAESWAPVADWALRMRATGRSVIFVHHAGKGGQQRGTSKREDLLDTVISLRRPTDYEEREGARFIVSFEKARSLHGQEVDPIEATLTTDESGLGAWTFKAAAELADKKIIELAELGLSQSDIASGMGVHKSTVCRALAKAQAEGRYKPATPEKGARRGR